jgi:hypothetical protein
MVGITTKSRLPNKRVLFSKLYRDGTSLSGLLETGVFYQRVHGSLHRGAENPVPPLLICTKFSGDMEN